MRRNDCKCSDCNFTESPLPGPALAKELETILHADVPKDHVRFAFLLCIFHSLFASQDYRIIEVPIRDIDCIQIVRIDARLRNDLPLVSLVASDILRLTNLSCRSISRLRRGSVSAPPMSLPG